MCGTYIEQVLRLGRYEIESEIGQGSMGVVYLARDPRVRRRLALKTYLLPRGLSREEEKEFSERFLREAQAAGALSHPAIVTVFDADEDPTEGVPFIAMEYVPGSSLRQILHEEGRLEPGRAIAIILTLADALQAAHDAGIVHRDIKPANVLVRDSDGAVKIADFGVARLSASELTRSGLSFGSPAYMAPEQFRGAPVDGRCDLFSLSVILYQTLTGARPFNGPDLMAMAYAVVNDPPTPITTLMPEFPRSLDLFFDRALAKDPADRFQSATEFKEALENAWFAARPARALSIESTQPVRVVFPAAAETPSAPRTQTTSAPMAPARVAAKNPARAQARGRLRGIAIAGAIGLLVIALAVRAFIGGGGATRTGGGQGSRARATMTNAAATRNVTNQTTTGTKADASLTQTIPRLSPPATKTDKPSAARTSGASPVKENARTGKQQKPPLPPVQTVGPFLPDPEPPVPALAVPAVVEAPAETPPTGTPGKATAVRDSGTLTGENNVVTDDTEIVTGLSLVVKSRLESGTLKVFVDGRPVFSRHLSGAEKAKGFWKKVLNRPAETFKAKVRVDTGKHSIAAMVVPDGARDGAMETAGVEVKAAELSKIKITIGKADSPPIILDAD